MTTTTQLTEAAVKKLVDDWYVALDVHAPWEEVVPFVASSGLECSGPRGRRTASMASRAGTTASPGPSSTRSTR